jgi:GH25 family lysozyme M1 (1,4-beta-N-acetylmuramidase)
MIRGIDVSRHQGTVDWGRVARAGVRFAYLKATEGTSLVDPYYVRNRTGARLAGVVQGPYHFARPALSGPRDQMAHFVRTAGKWEPGALPHALDVEVTGGDVVRWTLDALRWLEDLSGRTPVLYTYRSYWRQHFAPVANQLARYPLWLARYLSQDPGQPCVIWQWSSQEQVDGVTGRVDANWFLGDEVAFRRFIGYPTPTRRRIPDMLLVQPEGQNAVYLMFGRGDAVGLEEPADLAVLEAAGIPRITVRQSTWEEWMRR